MTILLNVISTLIFYRIKTVLIMTLLLSFSQPVFAQEVLWEKLNSKSNTLFKQKRYSEALSVAREALTVAEDTFGSDNLKVATTLNRIAELYIIKGSYAEIEPLYKRTLEISKTNLGSDHPDVAIALNNLAELYYNQGRYTEAEPLYKQALKILETSLGSDHPEVALTLANLEALYKKTGKSKKSE